VQEAAAHARVGVFVLEEEVEERFFRRKKEEKVSSSASRFESFALFSFFLLQEREKETGETI